MSALARYFFRKGIKVSGYDKTPTPLTNKLIEEGIEIHFEENLNFIPKEVDLVVYTPAIPQTHIELKFYKENNYLLKKRSEILGEITKNHFTIAIAGTHGKTTISSMVAHIMKHAGVEILGFVGGITQNYQSNIFTSDDFKAIVVEADEYDRSFLTLHPDISIISSMDADHLDIYGSKEYLTESFNLFANQTKENGTLIYKKDLPVSESLSINKHEYSANLNSYYFAENIRKVDDNYFFDFIENGNKLSEIKLITGAYYNIENSVAAISACLNYGIEIEKIKSAMAEYKGVKRRFDYKIKNENIIYIDDYAHHPEELKACISSVKRLYPNKKITGVFQPHLFSRTRDFADEFAKSLEMLDELILLDIYPARELPIEGVTSEMLLNKVNLLNKLSCAKDQLVDIINERNVEVLLTLGAGDIDQFVEPLKEVLSIKYQVSNKN